MGLGDIVLLTHLEGVVGEAVVGFPGLVEHDLVFGGIGYRLFCYWRDVRGIGNNRV
jgi:hypothetical protein